MKRIMWILCCIKKVLGVAASSEILDIPKYTNKETFQRQFKQGMDYLS